MPQKIKKKERERGTRHGVTFTFLLDRSVTITQQSKSRNTTTAGHSNDKGKWTKIKIREMTKGSTTRAIIWARREGRTDDKGKLRRRD